MVDYVWDKEKAERIKSDPTRGEKDFEDCMEAIRNNKVLADIEHPVRNGQRILVLNMNNYAYVVPYVESHDTRFLKTMFPSRKYTKEYLR